MVPNYLSHVQSARSNFPVAWLHAHREGDSQRLDFIILLARELHAVDSRVGLNAKHGNPKDISADALNIKGVGVGHLPDGTPCQVIDCILRAGETDPNKPQPEPAWGEIADPVGASGIWVDPFSVEPSTVVPVPAPSPEKPVLNFIARDAVGRFFGALNTRYQEAGRPNRSKKNDDALYVDNEGLFVWIGEFLRRTVVLTDDKGHVLVLGETEEAATKHVLADVEAALPKPS